MIRPCVSQMILAQLALGLENGHSMGSVCDTTKKQYGDGIDTRNV